MKYKKLAFFFSMTMFYLILFQGGCISFPNMEMADAQKALLAAKEAGADKYASEDYNKAESALNMAKKEVDDFHYIKAKDLSIESRDSALLARVNTEKMLKFFREFALILVKKAKESLSAAEVAGAEKYDPEDHRSVMALIGETDMALSVGEDLGLAYQKAELAFQRARRLELASKRAFEMEREVDEKIQKGGQENRQGDNLEGENKD